MISELTYLILEVVAITGLLLFATTVIASQPKNRDAWLFALVFISSACYLLTRMTFKANAAYSIDLGLLALPVQILMNLGSGFWMLFCFSMFHDRPRIPAWLLGLFVLQFALSLGRILFVPMELTELDRAPLAPATTFSFLTLPLLLQGCLGTLTALFTVSGWSDDLVNSRRVLRWVCIVYLAVVMTSVVLVEIALPAAGPAQRIVLNNVITLLVAVSACVLVVFAGRISDAFLRASIESRESTRRRPTQNRSTVVNETDYRTFLEVFEVRKAYLQHGLTIGGLAEQMGIPQYRLRRLIHSRLGYRNFNALLHAYRIRDACEQLADPGKTHVPVLTIALSLGYQSIATFNKAFRDIVGQAPSSYRKANAS